MGRVLREASSPDYAARKFARAERCGWRQHRFLAPSSRRHLSGALCARQRLSGIRHRAVTLHALEDLPGACSICRCSISCLVPVVDCQVVADQPNPFEVRYVPGDDWQPFAIAMAAIITSGMPMMRPLPFQIGIDSAREATGGVVER